jgi:hypothetical protein
MKKTALMFILTSLFAVVGLCLLFVMVLLPAAQDPAYRYERERTRTLPPFPSSEQWVAGSPEPFDNSLAYEHVDAEGNITDTTIALFEILTTYISDQIESDFIFRGTILSETEFEALVLDDQTSQPTDPTWTVHRYAVLEIRVDTVYVGESVVVNEALVSGDVFKIRASQRYKGGLEGTFYLNARSASDFFQNPLGLYPDPYQISPEGVVDIDELSPYSVAYFDPSIEGWTSVDRCWATDLEPDYTFSGFFAEPTMNPFGDVTSRAYFVGENYELALRYYLETEGYGYRWENK